MLDEAVILQPENAEFHCEIANQKNMMGLYEEAYKIYQQASAYDQTNQNPLYGMIQCKIHLEQLDDAEQQLEFLMEISESE